MFFHQYAFLLIVAVVVQVCAASLATTLRQQVRDDKHCKQDAFDTVFVPAKSRRLWAYSEIVFRVTRE